MIRYMRKPITWPRRRPGNEVGERSKATRKGAIHYVNPSGTVGATRRFRRRIERIAIKNEIRKRKGLVPLNFA